MGGRRVTCHQVNTAVRMTECSPDFYVEVVATLFLFLLGVFSMSGNL